MSIRKIVRKVDKVRIYRAVASSSAIETGQPVRAIELKLKSGKHKFRNLALAD